MFPVLQTKRFVLRRIQAWDKPKIYEGLSDPSVIQYYGVSYASLKAAQAQMDWYEHLHTTQTGIWWAICAPDNQASLLGACGFNEWKKEHNRIELGYWLLPQYWGKGIIGECLLTIINYAFTHMGIHRIEAVVETENHRSNRLLTKLGFTYEGTRKECELKNGQYIDLAYYAVLNPDS